LESHPIHTGSKLSVFAGAKAVVETAADRINLWEHLEIGAPTSKTMNNKLRYKLFRVRGGKLPKLKAWAAFLYGHQTEVLETLNEENVAQELLYLFEINTAWYCMAMQSLTGDHKKADLTKTINQDHLETLGDCLEEVPPGEILYDFLQNENQSK
jgi:hypothetical protein